MVLLDRAMVSSHKLSVQTAVVSGTVWPQFAMQFLTGGCEPRVWEKSGCRKLNMGPLRSPVAIGLSLAVFAVLRLVTDRWNLSSKRRYVHCASAAKKVT